MAKKNVATFLGPSLTLSYAGDHAYAYSGIIAVGADGIGTYSTLLDFNTGNSYTVAQVQFSKGLSAAPANDYAWRIYLNGNIIMEFDDTASDRTEYPINLIIPPHTDVQVTAANISTTTPTNLTALLTGRVYA